MDDNAKKIGLIALIVVALGLLAFSFRANFMGGPAPAAPEVGRAMGEALMEQARQNRERGNVGGMSGSPNAQPTGVARPPIPPQRGN
jgi:hypothetical protein